MVCKPSSLSQFSFPPFVILRWSAGEPGVQTRGFLTHTHHACFEREAHVNATFHTLTFSPVNKNRGWHVLSKKSPTVGPPLFTDPKKNLSNSPIARKRHLTERGSVGIWSHEKNLDGILGWDVFDWKHSLNRWKHSHKNWKWASWEGSHILRWISSRPQLPLKGIC